MASSHRTRSTRQTAKQMKQETTTTLNKMERMFAEGDGQPDDSGVLQTPVQNREQDNPLSILANTCSQQMQNDTTGSGGEPKQSKQSTQQARQITVGGQQAYFIPIGDTQYDNSNIQLLPAAAGTSPGSQRVTLQNAVSNTQQTVTVQLPTIDAQGNTVYQTVQVPIVAQTALTSAPQQLIVNNNTTQQSEQPVTRAQTSVSSSLAPKTQQPQQIVLSGNNMQQQIFVPLQQNNNGSGNMQPIVLFNNNNANVNQSQSNTQNDGQSQTVQIVGASSNAVQYTQAHVIQQSPQQQHQQIYIINNNNNNIEPATSSQIISPTVSSSTSGSTISMLPNGQCVLLQSATTTTTQSNPPTQQIFLQPHNNQQQKVTFVPVRPQTKPKTIRVGDMNMRQDEFDPTKWHLVQGNEDDDNQEGEDEDESGPPVLESNASFLDTSQGQPVMLRLSSAGDAQFAASIQSACPKYSVIETNYKKRQACACPNCKANATLPPAQRFKHHVCHVAGCERTYGKTSHLRAHLRGHIGHRPFVCDWPHCIKSFTRSDELQRHRRTHETGPKPYLCNSCGKRFLRSDHLRKHAKTHGINLTVINKTPLPMD